MVAIIGRGTGTLCKYLEEKGLDAAVFQEAQVPSLMTLLLTMHRSITDMVILPDAQKSWSMGHILSAAKHLQDRGRLVFYEHPGEVPALISVAKNKEELLRLLLNKPAKPGAKVSAGAGGRGQAPMPAPERPLKISPLEIPPERILFLAIAGTQHRIGCTTQAVGLWHYCKALGFDPAVVASQEQIAQIAGAMHSQEIPGGYQIEGIPFIADAAMAYDCYILDVGTGSIPEALRSADYMVLVAGSKPWELQYTAAALRAVKGQEILILLSFSSQQDANALRPLFGRQNVAVLPWMPELWAPSAAALATYDRLLRPTLEKLLTREARQKDEEPQLQLVKGE